MRKQAVSTYTRGGGNARQKRSAFNKNSFDIRARLRSRERARVSSRTIKVFRHLPSRKVAQITSIPLPSRAPTEPSRELFEAPFQFWSHAIVFCERFEPFHDVFAQSAVASAQDVRGVDHVDAARFDVEFGFRVRE